MSQTVERAIHILRVIAHEPTRPGDVAESMGLHRSTVLRLLQTLEEATLARRLPDGRFAVGVGIIPLAHRAMDSLDVRAIARTHLQQVREQTGHTVHLAQWFDPDVTYVDKIDGAGTVAMGSRVGLAAEAHTAAVAKVVVAYQPEEVRERVIAHSCYEPHTSTTITSPERLRHELDTIRDRGWAEDDAEKEHYINCVAVPIRDASGQVIASMSVTALTAAENLARLRERVPALHQVADQISLELGWRP